jgi:uncharacterized protein (DUF1499 family)
MEPTPPATPDINRLPPKVAPISRRALLAGIPFTALFSGGAGGLPPAEPVDFATLQRPGSPNTCLAAPLGTPGVDVVTPPLTVAAAVAWPVLRGLGEGKPRVTRLDEWPELMQAQWVARSAVLNFPDIIIGQVVPQQDGAGVFLYSASAFGYSDFGVNRQRVEAWLAAFDAALRRR